MSTDRTPRNAYGHVMPEGDQTIVFTDGSNATARIWDWVFRPDGQPIGFKARIEDSALPPSFINWGNVAYLTPAAEA